jgi:hypothetical protein
MTILIQSGKRIENAIEMENGIKYGGSEDPDVKKTSL